MLNIALCDDEPGQRAATGALLSRYLQARPEVSARVMAFPSSMELLEHVSEHGGFELYILDVIMPEQNGIEAGLGLRELNPDGAIIYLTASPDYAVDSYLARASNYLLKPVDEARFFEALDRALDAILLKKAASVPVKTREGTVLAALDDIVYAELNNRAVRYHLRAGEALDSVTIAGPFQEAVEPLLLDARFALCGTSFVVNLYFVKAVSKAELTLSDGRRVPLSRSMAGNVKKRWVEYWLGEYNA